MEKKSIRNKYKLKNNNNEEKPKETKKFEKTEKIVKNQETNFSNNNSYSSKRDNVFNNLYMVKDNKQKDNKIFLSNNYEEELTKEIKESVKDFKTNDKDDQINKMIKLLNMIKLCSTMNILKNDKTPIEIIPNLFLGSVGCASNLEELQNNKITHILCCASGIENKFPDKFKYYNVNLLDKENQNIRIYLDGTYKFIDDALKNGGRVFVHCYAGVSRSASILIAYLMKSKKMKFDEALNLLKSKRSKVNPNAGFILQLRAYEKEIFE